MKHVHLRNLLFAVVLLACTISLSACGTSTEDAVLGKWIEVPTDDVGVRPITLEFLKGGNAIYNGTPLKYSAYGSDGLIIGAEGALDLVHGGMLAQYSRSPEQVTLTILGNPFLFERAP